MDPELFFSPHAFRASVEDVAEFPMKPPRSHNFFLVTNPHEVGGTKKRYFVAASRGKHSKSRLVTCYDRAQAMRFDHLRLVESYAEFINQSEIFPDGAEFWVVMESNTDYKSEALAARVQPNVVRS